MPIDHRKWASPFDADKLTLKFAQRIFAPPCEIEVIDVALVPGQHVPAFAADDLDCAESVSEARVRAQRVSMVISALLFTRDPTRPYIYPKELYERRKDGSWREHPWQVAPRGGYVRPRDLNRSYPEKSIEDDPRERKWLAILEADNVIDTLHAVSGQPDWYDLWKAHEAVKRYRRQRHRNWPGQHDPTMDLFEKSATLQRHSPSNEHYRRAKRDLEKEGLRPMSLGQAAHAVARSISEWLEGESTALVSRKGRNARAPG
jgi:hypothetical protein